jgi:diaminohydroxyphosphoribosylaminopyrimidine deaminase / 5-amino-6-(5-phosphoribosylamino)uracil reductase
MPGVRREDESIRMTREADQAYEAPMRRALDLAARGPVVGGNPQVGCVLVNDAGDVIAEGWHRGAGTPHAEVDALSKVDDATGLTAVVILEPCNHTGRTGPCSVALISAGISRVVYAVGDPSKRADGGAERLAAAGVDVIRGVLATEVSEFLHSWLTASRLGRPYVTVKWASSLDGRAAAADGSSQWITGDDARNDVHRRRALVDAIIVGTGTVLTDDPELTARDRDGALLDHQPIPVVIGSREIPASAKIRSHPAGSIITGNEDLPAVLIDLFSRNIRRVIVEGGPTLASAFVAAGLVDDYLIYLAPTLLGGPNLSLRDIAVGTIADQKKLQLLRLDRLGDDILIVARPNDDNGGE